MKRTLLLSFSLVYMLSFVLVAPAYAFNDSDSLNNLTNEKIEIGQDVSEEESSEVEEKEKKTEEQSQTPPPKEEEEQKVTLTVNHHLTKNDLIVRGKLDKEVDDGVFNVTFQGITKSFEGPGSSFKAPFPRSKLKSGKYTLFVSFKGLIGDQVVKDQKQILITIPPKSKVTTPKGKDDSTKKSTKQTSNNKASTSKKPLKTAAKKTANQKIGGPLPKTATNLPTLALSGILLMGIGVAIWLRRRAY